MDPAEDTSRRSRLVAKTAYQGLTRIPSTKAAFAAWHWIAYPV